MSDWIEVPEDLMRETLEALLQWYPKGAKGLSDVPVALIDSVIEMFKEAGGCDHSVGICCCGEEALAQELLLLKDGKAVCRQCGGDTYIWDAEVYEAKRKQYADEGYADDSYGNVTCPGCDGKGVTRIAKEKIA